MSSNINRKRNKRNSQLERAKQIKKKFIHKAKIKQDFHKILEKERKILEPPSFYHEIFDVDKSFDDDTKIEKNLNTPSLSNEAIEKGREEDLNYQDKCNKKIPSGINRKVKEEMGKSKIRKSAKPNPFYKILQERERIQREKHAEEEEIRQRQQLRKQKKKAYNNQRNKTKKKFMKCNSKGQPVMKSRIDHILSKIGEY